MSIRVGIVGVSGYGGGEVLRLCATHPTFELVYVAGESSAGQKLIDRFPGIGKLGDLVVQKWDPAALPNLDVLFASLPTGESKAGLAAVSQKTKIVDIGGDHRAAEGWTYGLADVWPDRIRKSTRIANPGCYPAASLAALAPLVAAKIVDPHGIIIDAKSGVSGAGRTPTEAVHYSMAADNVGPYKVYAHRHTPEIEQELGVPVTFTPHLVPVDRGLLSTCYARVVGMDVPHQDDLLQRYADRYAGHPFVEVVERPPGMRAVQRTNFAQVCPMADPRGGRVTAFGVIDNLGKGAAGQAVQNLNIMAGLPETEGLL